MLRFTHRRSAGGVEHVQGGTSVNAATVQSWLEQAAASLREELATALDAALEGVVELGAAREGEKTMVDALAPAVRTLRERLAASASLADAVQAAFQASEEGMRATVPLQASKGRASYLGERSIGHQDPGATSTTLILGALASTVSA